MEPSEHVRPVGASPAEPPGPDGWPAGWSVFHVAETGSTNDDLLAMADDLADRTVLSAAHQTAGRGRLDRRWEAPPGANLLVSLLFRAVPDDPGELTRRVGLAVVDTVRRFAGQVTDRDGSPDVDCSLKWPNDVLVSGSKLAGILAQRHGNGSVVVGCGCNVGWAPDGAARLADVVGDTLAPTPMQVLDVLLRCYDALPVDVSGRYRSELGTLGRRVRITRTEGDLVGRAVDVEASGRLVVVDDCAVTHRVDVGDVVHLRPVDGPDGT